MTPHGSLDTVSQQLDAAALPRQFSQQRTAFDLDRFPNAQVRRDRLKRLGAMLAAHRDRFAQAIAIDFGRRTADETQLLEVFPSQEAIAHARSRVSQWKRPERRPTAVWFFPGRSYILTQPLGVIGIVVPWNYPILLALAPLTAALAAGNRVLIKPSELTPHASEALAVAITSVFKPDEVSVICGDATIAQQFVNLPFDHLLFTGSTAVGRDVMRRAAENLTPVTLELGGKSPALIAPDYPLEHAVERILVGKLMNAGQTCIAPDYVLCPESSIDAFITIAQRVVAKLYPKLMDGPDFSAIVADRHFGRLMGYLNDARAGGASIIPLVAGDPAPDPIRRIFPPVVMINVPDDRLVMNQEIFGPILPVVPYRDVDQAIAYINARPRPLALYLFDRNSGRVQRTTEQTVSGGVTLNDTILHVAQEELPFGGVGASGMGHYHGREGFNTFSKRKSVFAQSRFNGMKLLNPPYGRVYRNLVKLLTR